MVSYMNYKSAFTLKIKDIALTILFCIAAIVLSSILNYFTKNHTTVLMIFLLSVFFTARFTNGYLCGIIASFLSIFPINYFFTYPYFELNMTLPGYPVTIVTMIIVSVVTSMVTTRLLEQDKLKKKAEHEAMRSNLPSVRIIHGKGTGALRAAVQQSLSKNKFIKKYRLGVYGEGEDGVTIAEFK